MKTKEIHEINRLSEAVSYVYPNFEGMEQYFKKSEDEFAAFCHSQLSGGIGMKIRNLFNFWTDENSVLYTDLKLNHGCEHPDSMSDKIIRGVYQLKHSLNFIGYVFSNYEVKESNKAGSIHCKSSTGISDDILWKSLLDAIKFYFAGRFQEVYHNTNHNHVDFTIYLKA